MIKMAKKEAAPKTVLERAYNVPLRREYLKAPNWKRTPKAVRALKQFISKHMKSEDVRIGIYANQLLWKDGIKKPPHHIKVNAVKDDKGVVKVELVDLPGKAKREMAKLEKLDKKAEAKEKEEKAKKELEKKTKEKDSKTESKGSKTVDADFKEVKKEETKTQGPSEEKRAIEKEEIKELKKELPKQHAPKVAPQPKQVQRQASAPKSQ